MRPLRRPAGLLAAAALGAGLPLFATPPEVRTFTGGELSGLGNSHWFVTGRGSVVIDTPFLPAEVEALRSDLGRAGGLPVGAILLTGSRPERSWGTAGLAAGGTPRVWASKAAAAALRSGFHAERERWLRLGLPLSMMPKAAPVVTNTFVGSLNLGFEGFTIRLSEVPELGGGASLVVIPETGDAFVGELIWSRTHPDLAGVDLGSWKQALWGLRGMRIRRIHPGHGPSGGPELIEAQIDYLGALEEAVRPLARSGKEPSAAAVADVRKAMVARYRGWALQEFLDRSIRTEWRRQRALLAEELR